jgi:hypothetical protein|tara:strand:- start:71 stop:280 length:210 start_codon:yes stop_codon:yes gene_type:complete
MKKIKLPERSKPAMETTTILSARVTYDTHKKWTELQCKEGKSRIRPSDLMTYMVDYFHDEVFGEHGTKE